MYEKKLTEKPRVSSINLQQLQQTQNYNNINNNNTKTKHIKMNDK